MKITSNTRIKKSNGFHHSVGGTIQYQEVITLQEGLCFDGKNTLVLKHPREQYALYIGSTVSDLSIRNFHIRGLNKFSWKAFYYLMKDVYKFWRPK